jgi:hypothetical protein
VLLLLGCNSLLSFFVFDLKTASKDQIHGSEHSTNLVVFVFGLAKAKIQLSSYVCEYIALYIFIFLHKQLSELEYSEATSSLMF